MNIVLFCYTELNIFSIDGLQDSGSQTIIWICLFFFFAASFLCNHEILLKYLWQLFYQNLVFVIFLSLASLRTSACLYIIVRRLFKKPFFIAIIYRFIRASNICLKIFRFLLDCMQKKWTKSLYLKKTTQKINMKMQWTWFPNLSNNTQWVEVSLSQSLNYSIRVPSMGHKYVLKFSYFIGLCAKIYQQTTTHKMLIWTYNERDSLTSRHEINPN